MYKWLWDQKRKISGVEKLISPECDVKFKNGLIVYGKANHVNPGKELQAPYHIKNELK